MRCPHRVRYWETPGFETRVTAREYRATQVRTSDPGEGRGSVQSWRSDPDGRSATSRLASERGEDRSGGREEPRKYRDVEDSDHHCGIDDASDLLMEIGTNGAGIAGMRPVVILGEAPAARCPGFRNRLRGSPHGAPHARPDSTQSPPSESQAGSTRQRQDWHPNPLGYVSHVHAKHSH